MLAIMEKKQETNPLIGKLRRAIGARVATLREEKERRDGKFSQNDLAAALRETGQKVEQSQIGHIESGRRLPSTELFYSLAEFFGTSLDFIAGRTRLQSSIAAIEEDLQTGGISGRLGEIYKKLPLERQEEVYKFAEALNLIGQNDVPQIGPLPLNRQQRRKSAVRALLDLIERERDAHVRDEIEKVLRSKGIRIDLDP